MCQFQSVNCICETCFLVDLKWVGIYIFIIMISLNLYKTRYNSHGRYFDQILRNGDIVWQQREMRITDLIQNSLWPSGDIWRQKSWSTSVQVMACCLTTQSHYLNQCWLINNGVLWHSLGEQFHMKCARYPSINEHVSMETASKWRFPFVISNKHVNSLAPGGFDYSLRLVNFKLISIVNILSISCEIVIRWMPKHLTDY